MKTQRLIQAAAIAVGLLVGVTACGGGDDGRKPSPVGTKELCDGIFSPAAAKALETNLGVKKSELHSRGDSLDKTAELIVFEVDHFGVNPENPTQYQFCSIYTPSRRGDLPALDLTFELVDRSRFDDSSPASSYDTYRMGRWSLASKNRSAIYFECASHKMESTKRTPALIRTYLFKEEASNDGSNIQEANLTITHAAALALARELECKDNGGLPTEPDLRPKP